MKPRNTRLILAILLLETAAGSTAAAADAGGFYAGVNLGVSRIGGLSSYKSQVETQTAGTGSLDIANSSRSNGRIGWSAEAGYMITPHVGIEIHYLEFGGRTDSLAGTYAPAGGQPEAAVARRHLSSRGPAIGLMVVLPLVDRVDLRLRAAGYYGRSTRSESQSLGPGSSVSASSQVDALGLLLGLGAACRISDHWSAELGYQTVQRAGRASSTGKFHVNRLSISGGFAF
jgi:opacity protein-like surface antigen